MRSEPIIAASELWQASLLPCLEAARRGSREALGQLLESLRPYLLLVANEELNGQLRPKVGASDLVQETFLKAQVGFVDFQGTTQYEFQVWLRRILYNSLADQEKRYLQTDKRSVGRERPLTGFVSGEGPYAAIRSESTSPSGRAIRKEEAQFVERSMRQLRDDYRQVLVLRHHDSRSFTEIGRIMQRSPDAARMLWWRAVKHLAKTLERLDGRSTDNG